MPSCRNCGADLGDAYRFCPMCATPQTEEASRRLEAYVSGRAERLANGGAGGIAGRLRYAVGYVCVVAGLATLPSVAGVFFFLAGLLALPPVQTAVESRLGRRLGRRPAVAAAGLVAAGAAAVLV